MKSFIKFVFMSIIVIMVGYIVLIFGLITGGIVALVNHKNGTTTKEVFRKQFDKLMSKVEELKKNL